MNKVINKSETHGAYTSELRTYASKKVKSSLSAIWNNNFVNNLLIISKNYSTTVLIMSCMLRFVNNRRNSEKTCRHLTAKELEHAEIFFGHRYSEKRIFNRPSTNKKCVLLFK